MAPLAGATDLPFRLIARRMGASLAYTEMVSASAVVRGRQGGPRALDTSGLERPAAVQLFGATPEVMAEAARRVVARGAGLVDINAGCPKASVIEQGGGAALLREPERLASIVEAVAGAVDAPVTAKIRTGWSAKAAESGAAVKVAKMLEAAGAAAVTVHGRTVEQRYAGRADWARIREVVESVSMPVVGNGDVWSGGDALRMVDETGCAAVMLGRGALGNPWLIREVDASLRGRRAPELPTLGERLDLLIEHGRALFEHQGQRVGSRRARVWAFWYLKGVPKVHVPAKKINSICTLDDLAGVAEHVRKAAGDGFIVRLKRGR